MVESRRFVAQFSLDYEVSPSTVQKDLETLRDAGLVTFWEESEEMIGTPERFEQWRSDREREQKEATERYERLMRGLMSGEIQPTTQQERVLILLKILEALQSQGGAVREEDFISEVIKRVKLDEEAVRRTLHLLLRDGTVYYPQRGYILKA